MAELTDSEILRETVREKYAAAARAAAAGAAVPSSCCGPSEVALSDASGTQVFGDALYGDEDAAGAGAALEASLGAACRPRSPICTKAKRSRPRLGRWRRRLHQRGPRRADRPGHRSGHDRRDARARPRQRRDGEAAGSA